MSGSKKQMLSPANADRRRKGAPIVSVLAALILVIACAILVAARNNWWARGDAEPAVSDTDNISEDLEPDETADAQGITEDAQGIIVELNTISTDGDRGQKTQAVAVKGLYIDAWTAREPANIDWLIRLCEASEINAIVIDFKEDNGYITFISDNQRIFPACNDIIPDMKGLVSRLSEHNIYTIARVVCFMDPLMSKSNPNLAIQNRNGTVWRDRSGIEWLDPYNEDSWEYIATVAKEAAKIGFDEIQLDYVRFPADGSLEAMDFGSAAAEKTKAEIIRDFIEFMKIELGSTKARLSADVFGIIAVSKGDFEGIGQDLDLMWDNLDSICPMIYPSHFANIRQNGIGQIINGVLFERPDLEPYGVVYNILEMTRDRLPNDGDHAAIRPYLQAFTASYLGSGYYQTYTADHVLQQINAVYDAGFDEWILWNNTGRYDIYNEVSTLLQ